MSSRTQASTVYSKPSGLDHSPRLLLYTPLLYHIHCCHPRWRAPNASIPSSMINRAVSPGRQNSRRDASFALLRLSLSLFFPPSQSPSTEYFSSLSLSPISCFLFLIVLCTWFLSSSSSLPLHAVLSSAALLCRIALFVKPTTPSSLPPSWLYRTPPLVCAESGETLQSCS